MYPVNRYNCISYVGCYKRQNIYLPVTKVGALENIFQKGPGQLHPCRRNSESKTTKQTTQQTRETG